MSPTEDWRIPTLATGTSPWQVSQPYPSMVQPLQAQVRPYWCAEMPGHSGGTHHSSWLALPGCLQPEIRMGKSKLQVLSLATAA